MDITIALAFLQDNFAYICLASLIAYIAMGETKARLYFYDTEYTAR